MMHSRWVSAMPAVFVVIWSTGFIAAKYGMPYSPPFSFLEVRYVLSIVVLALWVRLAHVNWPKQRLEWLHLAMTGILMHAGYLGGVWAAVKLGMGAGLAALIVGLQPVLTGVWLSARGGRIQGIQWLGLVLGFSGLCMVLFQKIVMTQEVTGVSLMWALVALLSITTGTLYQKRFVAPCDVRAANFIQLCAAACITLPFAAMETETIHWTFELWGAVIWSVFGLTVGGSSLLYLLIQRGAATSVTSLMYLVPPTTAVIAWFLFDEPMTALILLGIAVTALGVGMVVRFASNHTK